MANTKLKEKKKKDRERAVKDKLHNRRLAKIKAEKEKKAWEEKTLREAGMKENDKYSKPPAENIVKKMTPQEIRERLEKNLQILKALEEEYEKTHGKKMDLMEAVKKSNFGKLNSIEDALKPIVLENTAISITE